MKFTAHATTTGNTCGPNCSCHGGISASDRETLNLIKDFVAAQPQLPRAVFNEADAVALGMISQHRETAVHVNSVDANSIVLGMVTFHAPSRK